MNIPRDTKLCYVEGNSAYFTTNDLQQQWGDDWDAVPYQHNAGKPYRAYLKEDFNEDGTPKWELIHVMFESIFFEPYEYDSYDTQYSVEQINQLNFPWLCSYDRGIEIWAGTSLGDFIKIIEEAYGKVFLDKETYERIYD